jgi:hypothetical protein
MSVVKVLECVECRKGHSEWDVKGGKFFITTMMCLACYQRMQRSPHRECCFGKPTVVRGNKTWYGYDPRARECAGECPDRHICRVMTKIPPAKRDGLGNSRS